MDWHNNIGLSGIPACENIKARRIGRTLRYCEIPVIIWLTLQWHLELFKALAPWQTYLADWLVWLFFFIKFFIMWSVVDKKQVFLRKNWGYIGILVLGTVFLVRYPPLVVLFQFSRLFLVLLLLVPWIDACRSSLSDNRLGTTVLTAFIIILLAGIMISGIDPNIQHWYDGIWWALVTVSTVGYGDVVPNSFVGRVFAALLILMGLALFSVFTANFSAMFIQRSRGHRNEQQKHMLKLLEEMRQLHHEEHRLESSVIDIRRKLDDIEKMLADLKPPHS